MSWRFARHGFGTFFGGLAGCDIEVHHRHFGTTLFCELLGMSFLALGRLPWMGVRSGPTGGNDFILYAFVMDRVRRRSRDQNYLGPDETRYDFKMDVLWGFKISIARSLLLFPAG